MMYSTKRDVHHLESSKSINRKISQKGRFLDFIQSYFEIETIVTYGTNGMRSFLFSPTAIVMPLYHYF